MRVLRVLRVVRIVRSTRLLTHLWAYRFKHVLAAISTLSLLVTALASVAILQFEHAGGGNIQTSGDALWWALSTVTTVGYGDRYPVTVEGRVVAAILMVFGVGLFGTFTAFVSRMFISPAEHNDREHLDQVHAELKALRLELSALREALVSAAEQKATSHHDSAQ